MNRPLLRHRAPILLLAAFLVLAAVSACAPPEDAPDFQVTLYSGEDFQLSGQLGQGVTVVNFWYPSCPPCRAEMPEFQRAWQEHQGQGVRFLGLFVPLGIDSEQDARGFIEDLGLTFDFATDQRGAIARSYQVEYFPTTYFIDRQGQVFRMKIANLDAAAISGIVRDMLGG